MVISAAIWGRRWHNHVVTFTSDNMAVAHSLTKGSAKDPHMAHLLHYLFFFEAYFMFQHQASHIAGKDNTGANALSRGNLTTFFSLFPQAQATPTCIVLAELVELLFNTNLTWTLPTWKYYFQFTLAKV